MFQDDDYRNVEVDFERNLPPEQPEKRQVCMDYLRGACPRNPCPYKHTYAHLQDEVCKYWLRGLCKKRGDCEFLHVYDVERIPECFYYQKFGECHNPECVFRHLLIGFREWGLEQIPECAAYNRGFCCYGPACRLRHVKREACPNYMAGLCLDGNSCKLGHPRQRFVTEDDVKQRLIRGEGIEEIGAPPHPKSDRNDMVCFKCTLPGHVASQCQGQGLQQLKETLATLMKKTQEPRGIGCFFCQTDDHLSVDCPKKKDRYMQHREAQDAVRDEALAPERRVMKCFSCGEEGHMSRECPNAGGRDRRDRRDNAPRCYICNETGHMASRCPNRPDRPARDLTIDGPMGEGAGGGFFPPGGSGSAPPPRPPHPGEPSEFSMPPRPAGPGGYGMPMPGMYPNMPPPPSGPPPPGR
eukprot:TRINITY_DN7533_c4_g1_i1.p1 TRINITY_DN7533_c4_g1~~TRINITY_DN7533_c4_g1_i1.p1  ORF type:complete len:411 (+),score=111.50 TRINITY_DN7533_c4_g1_i1:87-1319(+)